MRRLVTVAAGVLLAFPAGCCFLATAVFMGSLAVPLQTTVALVNLAALLTSLHDGSAASLLGAGLTAIWLTLLAVCLAFVVVVALLGEAFRRRSIIWHAGGTGLVTAGTPAALRAIADMPTPVAAVPGEGRAMLILFLTGIAAGFVYWFIAGRSTPAG